MILRKYRWSKHYESAEEELIELLIGKKIDAERWTAEEYEEFKAHKHPLDKQLWCAEGSISFIIGGKEISMQTGDALELPAGTVHQAKAGFSGCVCYEYPRISDNPMINI
jgi:quercetin dioxygenase-like cupin family protein